jgi:hypothetical protein
MSPHFGLLGNLHLYMTDRTNPRMKGEHPWTDADLTRPAEKTLPVARLKHQGPWNPEPAGWRRITNLLLTRDRVGMLVQELDPAELTQDVRLAHLTSAAAFRLTPQQLEGMRRYLQSGGLLLADAAGGRTDAADSVEQMLRGIEPTGEFRRLQPDHPIFTGKGYGGEVIDAITYRRFATERVGRSNLPRLRGFYVNNELRAIVSAEDLSAGLVGYQIDGIIGYTPATAEKIVRNLLLWRGK